MNKGDKITLKNFSYNAQKSTIENSVYDDEEVTIIRVNPNTYTVSNGSMFFRVRKDAV